MFNSTPLQSTYKSWMMGAISNRSYAICQRFNLRCSICFLFINHIFLAKLIRSSARYLLHNVNNNYYSDSLVKAVGEREGFRIGGVSRMADSGAVR